MQNAYEKKEFDMDDYLKAAIDLVQAQAHVRPMTEEEIAGMVASLRKKLILLDESVQDVSIQENDQDFSQKSASRSIREKSIVCLVCGESFKVITKKHLAKHGLDAVSYRERFGLPKGKPLACKALVAARKKKMEEMQLWKFRSQNLTDPLNN